MGAPNPRLPVQPTQVRNTQIQNQFRFFNIFKLENVMPAMPFWRVWHELSVVMCPIRHLWACRETIQPRSWGQLPEKLFLSLAVDRSSSCASSISCSPWWWPSSEMLLQHPIKPCHDKDVTPVENWAKDDKYRHIQLVKYRTWKDSECIQYTACFWNNDWCSQTASCKCWQFRNWPWFCSFRCRVCCLYLVSYLVS